jgi:hypothetical protein
MQVSFLTVLTVYCCLLLSINFECPILSSMRVIVIQLPHFLFYESIICIFGLLPKYLTTNWPLASARGCLNPVRFLLFIEAYSGKPVELAESARSPKIRRWAPTVLNRWRRGSGRTNK